ncbi:hypothetical protein Ancab_001319 [Ancistrocladus abbreviatus]
MEKLLSLSPFSSAGLIHDGRSEPKLWRLQAETLIRELNLIPKEPVKIVKGTDHALPRAKDGPRLVEKPFEFPNFDVSVEDLGHHAGYHQIADSYEARDNVEESQLSSAACSTSSSSLARARTIQLLSG